MTLSDKTDSDVPPLGADLAESVRDLIGVLVTKRLTGREARLLFDLRRALDDWDQWPDDA